MRLLTICTFFGLVVLAFAKPKGVATRVLLSNSLKQDCEGTLCPSGCCAEQNYYCCPDGIYCAADANSCPPVFKNLPKSAKSKGVATRIFAKSLKQDCEGVMCPAGCCPLSSGYCCPDHGQYD